MKAAQERPAVRRKLPRRSHSRSVVSRIPSQALRPGGSGSPRFHPLLRLHKSTSDEERRAAWHENQIQGLGTPGRGAHDLQKVFIFLFCENCLDLRCTCWEMGDGAVVTADNTVVGLEKKQARNHEDGALGKVVIIKRIATEERKLRGKVK